MKMNRGKICVAVSVVDAAAAVRVVNPLVDKVDVVEIRLDAMKVPQINQCLNNINKPLLFTNRPTWEGGHCQLPEKERLATLRQAAEGGAHFIDIELRTESSQQQSLIKSIRPTTTKTIISSHDFSTTPSLETLQATLSQMIESGCDIGKIITTAHSSQDVLRVLTLQAEAVELGFPLSAFCMGAAGKISRFATLYLGGFMSYVAVDELQATAPGQFSVDHFHQLTTIFEQYYED